MVISFYETRIKRRQIPVYRHKERVGVILLICCCGLAYLSLILADSKRLSASFSEPPRPFDVSTKLVSRGLACNELREVGSHFNFLGGGVLDAFIWRRGFVRVLGVHCRNQQAYRCIFEPDSVNISQKLYISEKEKDVRIPWCSGFCRIPEALVNSEGDLVFSLAYNGKDGMQMETFKLCRALRLPWVYLAAMAVVKDEGAYLVEWLEYLRLVGVGRVYVYDNNSTDGTPLVLLPYEDEGFAVRIFWPYAPSTGMQHGAANDALFRFGSSSAWLMLIDIDEFPVPVNRTHLSSLLHQYDPQYLPAVALTELRYGSSFHRSRPHGLVSESYTMRQRKCHEMTASTRGPRARTDGPHAGDKVASRLVSGRQAGEVQDGNVSAVPLGSAREGDAASELLEQAEWRVEGREQVGAAEEHVHARRALARSPASRCLVDSPAAAGAQGSKAGDWEESETQRRIRAQPKQASAPQPPPRSEAAPTRGVAWDAAVQGSGGAAELAAPTPLLAHPSHPSSSLPPPALQPATAPLAHPHLLPPSTAIAQRQGPVAAPSKAPAQRAAARLVVASNASGAPASAPDADHSMHASAPDDQQLLEERESGDVGDGEGEDASALAQSTPAVQSAAPSATPPPPHPPHPNLLQTPLAVSPAHLVPRVVHSAAAPPRTVSSPVALPPAITSLAFRVATGNTGDSLRETSSPTASSAPHGAMSSRSTTRVEGQGRSNVTRKEAGGGSSGKGTEMRGQVRCGGDRLVYAWKMIVHTRYAHLIAIHWVRAGTWLPVPKPGAMPWFSGPKDGTSYPMVVLPPSRARINHYRTKSLADWYSSKRCRPRASGAQRKERNMPQYNEVHDLAIAHLLPQLKAAVAARHAHYPNLHHLEQRLPHLPPASPLDECHDMLQPLHSEPSAPHRD